MQTQTMEIKEKREYYKTARARISCALFSKGDFVAVRYLNQGDQGTHWFLVSASKEGLDTLGKSTCYPQKHLTDFVL